MLRQANMLVFSASGLEKVFGEGESQVHALRGVSLAIRAGEFLAIMGPSGSGKSTLLHMLAGMDTPTRGEIRFLDQDLAHQVDATLASFRRRRIGFVFQTFNLLPALTALQNVALPLLLDGVSYRVAIARARTALESLGMSHRLDKHPSTMSGGEQQRVAVARALVIEPAAILADEPTGNLDSENSAQILRLLRRIVDEWKQTVVIVTHDLSVAKAADRVVLLRDGRVVSDLPTAALSPDSLNRWLITPASTGS
jgi:putative ABC transport system ATP-binding protein